MNSNTLLARAPIEGERRIGGRLGGELRPLGPGRTFRTGTNRAEMVVGVDARGMTVREGDLDGVVADGGRGLRSGFGLEHRERGELA